jgi:hypothetical protein
VGSHPGPDDRQGQRQPSGGGEDGGDRVGLGGDPVGADPPGEQVHRLVVGENVQREGPGALGGGQAG